MVGHRHFSVLWSLAALYDIAKARAVLEKRDLVVDPAKYNHTIDKPFIIPPKGNGLSVEKPNMILFMPDQLRFDSVGIFGNDVSWC